MFVGIILDWTLNKYKDTTPVKLLEKHVNVPVVKRAVKVLGTVNMAAILYIKRESIYDFTYSKINSIKQFF